MQTRVKWQAAAATVIVCHTSWYPNTERARVRPLEPQPDRPDRVEHTAGEQQRELRGAERRDDRGQGDHDDPAHPDVEEAADAVQRAEARQRERHADDRDRPHDGEQRDAPGRCSASSVIGVYEPAMSTKIIAWSMRRSRARTCGVQLPVW